MKQENNKFYCSECRKMVSTHIDFAEENFPILHCKEPVVVQTERRFCDVCGNYVFDLDMENKNFEKAFKVFADKYKYPYWWKEPPELRGKIKKLILEDMERKGLLGE